MTCSVGDGRKAKAHGLCGTHAERLRRNGDAEPDRPIGLLSTNYAAVHGRLRRKRGRADSYLCAAPLCESRAARWAWQRTGPSEAGEVNGVRLTWGLDLDTYAPMCDSHSLMLDGGGTLTHCPKGHDRTVAGTYRNGSGGTSCAECGREKTRAARARSDQKEVMQ